MNGRAAPAVPENARRHPSRLPLATDRGLGRPRVVLEDIPLEDGEGWLLEVADGAEARVRVSESLLTVADGNMGTRGSLEEDGPSASPAVVAAGLYERAEGTGQALMALPSWVSLALPWGLGSGRRLLDLRCGVLWRSVPSGERAVFRSARWACLARPGTAVLVAEGPPWVLGSEEHGSVLERFERHSGLGGAAVGVMETHCRAGPDEAPGDQAPSVELARLVSVVCGSAGVTSADPDRSHRAARRSGVERLLAEQRRAWSRRWRTADVEVVGDRELTLAVRFAIFQLSAAVAGAGEAAVGARGMSGPAYAGHVIWDADVFVLPVLAATHAPSARAMLEYRIRRLGAARRPARRAAPQGARFPWESAADGTDVTPRSGVDELGHSVPISTGELEEHITADVAWSAWHYASVTADWEFLDGAGHALVTDTARYWASRVSLDGQGRAHIEGVTGPDEYHEDVDDNAFTNVMAAWNLRRGAELLERRARRLAAGSGDRGVARRDEKLLEEAARWRELADAMVTGYRPDHGRHEQFAGYDALEPLLASQLGAVPAPADLVLGRQRLAGSQIVKQADVVMAHHLVPDAMPSGSRRRDLEHYLARTSHGSSLSPSVHAAVAARAGHVDEAVDLLDLARRVDLDDLTATTAAGLHMAALGGLWQALVLGFAGVRVVRPDAALALDPRLPRHWRELKIRMTWHATPLALRIRDDSVGVRCASPLELSLGQGPPVTVRPPGAWVERQGGWVP